MARIRAFADVIGELHEAKKTGSLFINVVESSEDLIRVYLKNGDIYYLTYGSAVGDDCMEIIEYYTLGNCTFFDGLPAPAGIVPSKYSSDKFMAIMRKADKKVRVP